MKILLQVPNERKKLNGGIKKEFMPHFEVMQILNFLEKRWKVETGTYYEMPFYYIDYCLAADLRFSVSGTGGNS